MDSDQAMHAREDRGALVASRDELASVGIDKRDVSELEGAMHYLDAKVGELAEIVIVLEKRLDPILSVERDAMLESAAVAAVDPRSAHVKSISAEGARVEDVRSRLSRLIDRLDV